MNIQDYQGILVFAEQREGVISSVAFELLSKARELAEEKTMTVSALLMGHGIAHLANELHAAGADHVIIVDDQTLSHYLTEPYTHAFHQVIVAKKPEIVMLGATTIGRDLGPRLSARLMTGLTADCTQLDMSPDGHLMMTRPAFGGNLCATILCKEHRPQISTVRPGVMRRTPADPSRTGTTETFAVAFSNETPRVRVKQVVKAEKHLVDITEANILVSGGRGVGSHDGFDKLRALAACIKAEVSSSRAMVDAGLIGHERQVGQTGKTVRPDVYIACGISGAIQHLAGMEESDYIIAINKDKFAPIFGVADLGLVGDLHQIIPALTKKLSR
ncbi:electron transfer flavoprotein subunit alpha/FixB family protein [Porphyromonas sp. COT-239 OH1446]|uniref:electron transfer flavoprotein subunit alpha/FixB family protein n=1 Tax=Porphyromonas sp. COT-239 OH1446 TaxID=1515613 RepID=UPI00052B8CD6|nr:electron transfer flavoprotein subunit alpha/FixB family protein [Porphyromonas sp. COT-239 OH1446]KGN69344.1 electron transfer flavoprotein subunit alpha [Porphyromonas sp. COT-239 OH1446]